MSDRKNLSRSELVRLRREQEHAKEMKRALKEITRPVPVTSRAKPRAVKPKRKPAATKYAPPFPGRFATCRARIYARSASLVRVLVGGSFR